MSAVTDELTKLEAEAATPEVKTLLANERTRLEADAKAAISEVEAKAETWGEEFKAWWARVTHAL